MRIINKWITASVVIVLIAMVLIRINVININSLQFNSFIVLATPYYKLFPIYNHVSPQSQALSKLFQLSVPSHGDITKEEFRAYIARINDLVPSFNSDRFNVVTMKKPFYKAPGIYLQDQSIECMNTKRHVVLYSHGGGFTVQFPLGKSIVPYFEKMKCIDFLFVEYRLCPEHSLADALEDVYSSYTLLEQMEHFEDKSITLMGDSAGAALSLLIVADKLRDTPSPKLNSLVLLSPYLHPNDFYVTAPEEYVLNQSIMDLFRRSINNFNSTSKSSGVLYRIKEQNEKIDLPRTLLIYSKSERMAQSCTQFAELLKQSGEKHKVVSELHMPHTYPLYTSLPEALRVLEQIMDFIQN
jgi:acetyl esterase/lipase